MASEGSQDECDVRSQVIRNRRYPAKANYPALNPSGGLVVARHLTPEMYEKMYLMRTKNGYTLDEAIQYGVNMDGDCAWSPGIVAGDLDSYQVFRELYDKVIEDFHVGHGPDAVQETNLDSSQLVGGVFDEKYVKSCRIRTIRNIDGMLLSPMMSRAERRHAEKVVVDALMNLSGDLKGTYHGLPEMSPETSKQMVLDHLLFHKGTTGFRISTGVLRDWPDGRGIWYNAAKTVLVWLNEEDHARVISIQKGGNLNDVFAKFCSSLNEIEKEVNKSGHKYMWTPHLGYVACCPSNLGTGLRASVLIQLKHLPKKPEFPAILKSMGLQKRGTHGVNTPVDDGIYDISNQTRLGPSEVKLVQQMVDGINKVLEMEQMLEKGKDITHMMPKMG